MTGVQTCALPIYNLEVKTTMSGCVQGYVVQYAVKENELFLKNLWINCKNDIYPEINGVKAECLEPFKRYGNKYKDNYRGFYFYENISERLHFCGKIEIAKEPSIVEIRGIPVYAFRKVYELVFENGVLQSFCDVSRKQKNK